MLVIPGRAVSNLFQNFVKHFSPRMLLL